METIQSTLKKLRSSLERQIEKTDSVTPKRLAEFSIESWDEVFSKDKLNLADKEQLARLVKLTISNHIYKQKEKGKKLSATVLVLLILKAQKEMLALLKEERAPIQVSLEREEKMKSKPKPKTKPKPKQKTDETDEIADEEIYDYRIPESSSHTDKLDRRELDYKEKDLTLHPKRGVYKRWHNLIRFNAPDHFKERYLKAYAKIKDEEPTKDHGNIDREARSAIYKTLTPSQIADYSNRIRYHNRSNTSVYPAQSPDAFDLKNRLKERQRYFDHDLAPSDDAASQISEERPDEVDEEIGPDLTDDKYSAMSKAKYLEVRASIEERLRDRFIDAPKTTKGAKMNLTREERERIAARQEENLQKAVDDEIRKRYLHYALNKQYTRWYPAFTANLKKNYPHRYEAVLERGKLDGFKQSSMARTETMRAFNQKQLNDWRERTAYQTGALMGKSELLPKSGTLKTSPSFTKEYREAVMPDFIKHRKRSVPVDYEEEIISESGDEKEAETATATATKAEAVTSDSTSELADSE